MSTAFNMIASLSRKSFFRTPRKKMSPKPCMWTLILLRLHLRNCPAKQKTSPQIKTKLGRKNLTSTNTLFCSSCFSKVVIFVEWSHWSLNRLQFFVEHDTLNFITTDIGSLTTTLLYWHAGRICVFCCVWSFVKAVESRWVCYRVISPIEGV